MLNKRISLIITGMVSMFSLGGFVLSPVTAHHGWSEYKNDQTLNLTGIIKQINYGSPHVTIELETPDSKIWQAILAPPSRMQSRGLPQKALQVGQTIKLVGYPHRKTAGEIRAERIIIGEQTVELR